MTRSTTKEVDEAYAAFLDRFGFRGAFPRNGLLYSAIGEKQYSYWADVIQCARLSDTSDYLTISGWETTAIENHSGLVDCAPESARRSSRDRGCAEARFCPPWRFRNSAVLVGNSLTYDLFFLNETNAPQPGTLSVDLRSPDGSVRRLGAHPVPKFEKDVFSYPVAAGLRTPALTPSRRLRTRCSH